MASEAFFFYRLQKRKQGVLCYNKETITCSLMRLNADRVKMGRNSEERDMSNQEYYENYDETYVENEGVYEENYYEDSQPEVSIGKQGRMRVAAGVTDFFLVILGLVVILLCVTLLITLINWVIKDLYRSFFVIQTKIQ